MTQDELNLRVDQNYVDPNGILKPIYDGIINEELYKNSKARILWILREPYDKTTGKGGWNSRDHIDGGPEVFYKVKTWRRVALVSYGILNDCTYEETLKINDHFNSLRSIAYLNINKLPAGTTSQGREKIIGNIYDKCEKLLFDQIELCKPNIIILGATVAFFSEKLGLNWSTDKIINGIGGCSYHLSDRIIFEANHPGFRKTKYADEASYCNGIIKASLDWLKESGV
jgi:hypothetical protein